MILAFLSAAVLVFVPDYVIWKLYIKPSGRKLLKILWWLPTLLLILFGMGGAWGILHNFFMRAVYFLAFFSVVPKLMFALSCRLPGKKTPYIVSGISIIIVAYGIFFGFNRLSVREECFESREIPEAFDGFRIVHLSDLHVGTYFSGTMLRKICDKIRDLSPDLVVFTGDLVNVDPDETAPYAEILSEMARPAGLLSVLGNHDYGFKKELAGAMALKMTALESSFGWDVLNNGHAVIRRGADSIFVAGVENTSRNFFISRGDLEAALEGIPEGAFTVLLSHDPSQWEDEILPRSMVQLTLSGHTHAMQLKVFGLSPAALIFKEWGGKYLSDDGTRMINVSEGIGGIMPFRLGSWPEISVITLRSVKR